ncbi:polysaccharide deacetylase family protein [Hoeflea prorocentri]|uniref:Chitooligosaccharide deacetylase n=1 Tax=Hoeflea prorocentri TaxID=1922333 RepID=A0A9X3ZI88_9HYPH|nr:polysaccharide deacetylase family protein [Hoeflea prorocentri]MCY6381748.1 polysaccharide deacetylase family protein [Hoeflea prorocentri]MDA5399548.1 polysaccharide deacetylase family protein [Hoeflea prorocentri]
MIDGKEKLRKLVFKGLSLSRLPQLFKPFLGGRGAILMLHRVTSEPGTKFGFNDNLAVDPEFLDRLIADMKADGFEFVSIDEGIERMNYEADSDRFAVITLDDGFKDNLLEALPVFEKHQTPFVIYIAPGLTGGAVEPWWELVEASVAACTGHKLEMTTPDGVVSFDCSSDDARVQAFTEICTLLSEEIAEQDQVAAVRSLAESAGFDYERFRRDLLMDWDDIRTIAANPLCTIGAHTVHHYNLKRLSEDEARWEMTQSADLLEEILGERPRHLAYPYGFRSAAGKREAKLAKEAGFLSALTTRHGVIHDQHVSHMHALPRISVNGRFQNLDYLKTMLSGVTTLMTNRCRKVVTV